MAWKPISESDLLEMINSSYERMTDEQRYLWRLTKVHHQKWQLPPWGDEGNGFWVVALLGQNVVWYNDIEEGFNTSLYTQFGTIDDYLCNQDNLEWQVQRLVDQLKGGKPVGYNLGPPEPVSNDV